MTLTATNKYEEQFIRDGYYFLDFDDIDCLKFHIQKIKDEVESGIYTQEFQYEFARLELKEMNQRIRELESL